MGRKLGNLKGIAHDTEFRSIFCITASSTSIHQHLSSQYRSLPRCRSHHSCYLTLQGDGTRLLRPWIASNGEAFRASHLRPGRDNTSQHSETDSTLPSKEMNSRPSKQMSTHESLLALPRPLHSRFAPLLYHFFSLILSLLSKDQHYHFMLPAFFGLPNCSFDLFSFQDTSTFHAINVI